MGAHFARSRRQENEWSITSPCSAERFAESGNPTEHETKLESKYSGMLEPKKQLHGYKLRYLTRGNAVAGEILYD